MKIINTKYFSLTILVSSLSVVSVMAQNTFNTSTTQTPLTDKEKSPFRMIIGFEYSQDVAVDERAERKNSIDLALVPSYQMNDLASVTLKTILSQENSEAKQTQLSNTDLSLSVKGILFNNELRSIHALSVVAPTNDETQKKDRLKTSIGLTNGLSYTSPLLDLIYRLKLSKNFHEYTINADSQPNVEYRLSNALEATFKATDKFSIVFAGAYRAGLTYRNFERHDFTFDADMNYDISEKFSVNLGTSNKGEVAKSNGVESNLSAYAEDTSVIRAGLTLSL